MKAYAGGDEELVRESIYCNLLLQEVIQKTRGFKSYREMYTKKISQLDITNKNLREKQKEFKVRIDIDGNRLVTNPMRIK